MSISKAHTVFATFIVLMIACWSLQASALEVKSVRYGNHPDKVRLVIDMDQIADFRVFTLSTPYRIVVDLPTFTWSAGDIESYQTAYISAVRQGKLKGGISRIVLDLDRPAAIQSAFFLPKNDTRPDRLVIDYTPVDAVTFEAKKSNIHGTLKTEDYLSAPINPVAQTETKITNGVPLPPPNAMRPSFETKKITRNQKRIIIIDPGHGGTDPGAIGHNKIYEKHVVLSIGKELKRELESTGRYRAILTRDRDVFIKLKDRVHFARDNNGDLFVSLHADSIKKKSVRGTSIYTISKKSSDAQTAALAKKENQADLMGGVGLAVEDQQVAYILGDFLMTETMNQSKFFANTLVEKIQKSGIRILDNPHRYAGFAVLKAPDIPSVLIETGFMSNRSEAELLKKRHHQQKIARAIRMGIDAYFEHEALNENN
ncbi:MAG: N-acetylmuramoyl-L-alanine amidase [Alcanivorax sp.]